jgi:hypothetical protein
MGTEYRDRYLSLYGSMMSSKAAAKPTLKLAPNEVTSSLRGLQWPVAKDVATPAWLHAMPNPAQTTHDPAAHYRPMSAQVGMRATSATIRQHGEHRLPNPAAKARYLQVPYVTGAQAEGAGIGRRPTSAQSLWMYNSAKQLEILEGSGQRLHERAASIASWTASRTYNVPPVAPTPEPWMTTSKKSYDGRPSSDAQQHRIRRFVSSPYMGADSLSSDPVVVTKAPIKDGSALHETAFLGVRGSDGSRRFVHVDTKGDVPTGFNPSYSTAYAPLRPPTPFVASQPASHRMDVESTVSKAAC